MRRSTERCSVHAKRMQFLHPRSLAIPWKADATFRRELHATRPGKRAHCSGTVPLSGTVPEKLMNSTNSRRSSAMDEQATE